MNRTKTECVRRASRQISVGGVLVGGNAPVSIQTMTTSSADDPTAVLEEIVAAHRAGAEIVRVAVPSRKSLTALTAVLAESPVPVVADVHFSADIAVAAAESGFQCVRINPGNIGGDDELLRVGAACAANAVPVRVGVNGGSLPSSSSTGAWRPPGPRALADAALGACRTLERGGCLALKVSIKASDVPTTVAANRVFAAETDYPLHLGVTEAGTVRSCTVKSAAGIGALLLDGIGDTIRVSLTGDVVEEVRIARSILEAAGCRQFAPDVVACPTCGRTQVDLVGMARAVERALAEWERQGLVPNVRKIAVMGCVVNGPGEARDADIGIAGGKGAGALFHHGEVVRTAPESRLVPDLLEHLRSCLVPLADYSPQRFGGDSS